MFRRKHSSNSHHPDDDDQSLHQAKMKELRAAIGPLNGRSAQFCTDACLRRYLEARNWNIDKSRKMLEETLRWRSVYKPEEIRWPDVASEGETGKVYRANFFDRQGRSVLILRPGRQNTTSHENQLRHLVYLLENAIMNLPEGQEQMVWLIDFTGWSLTNSVPTTTARETINILQNHFPERLGAAFLCNPPWIFEKFWKLVRIFLDPKTFQKVKFVYLKNEESRSLMKQTFDSEVLPAEFGGDNQYQYDHEEFSQMMSKDDLKTIAIWGIDDKLNQTVPSDDHASAEVAPEPFT